ncbi:MAG TPA: cation transporter, partial [Cellvibrionaceae bacterium]
MSDQQSVTLRISGMSCASCVGRVEKALSAVAGVDAVNVNLATGTAYINGHFKIDGDAPLIAAIKQAGYTAAPVGDTPIARDILQRDREQEQVRLTRAFMFAGLLTLPVFALEMGAHLIPPLHHAIEASIGQRNNWLIQFVLTTLVLFGPGWQFFRLGLPALLRLAPDMNSLVMLGTSAAWGYSLVATFASGLLPAGSVNVYY